MFQRKQFTKIGIDSGFACAWLVGVWLIVMILSSKSVSVAGSRTGVYSFWVRVRFLGQTGRGCKSTSALYFYSTLELTLDLQTKKEAKQIEVYLINHFNIFRWNSWRKMLQKYFKNIFRGQHTANNVKKSTFFVIGVNEILKLRKMFILTFFVILLFFVVSLSCRLFKIIPNSELNYKLSSVLIFFFFCQNLENV